MSKEFKFVIWWIKRDLRLEDNITLSQALSQSEFVLPLYVFEKSIAMSPDYSKFHLNAISEALIYLKRKLESLNSSIWIQDAELEDALEQVNSVLPLEAVFSSEETGSSFTYERDKRVKSYLKSKGLQWRESPTNGVIRGLKDRQYRSKLWNSRIYMNPLPTPDSVPVPENVFHAAKLLPCLPQDKLVQRSRISNLEKVSEFAAKQRLDSFLNRRMKGYSGGLSSPNRAFHSGSRLSAHLAWGTVSLRQVVAAVEKRKLEIQSSDLKGQKYWLRSLNAFTSRLHWRDHFIQRLESEPESEFLCLNRAFEDLPFRSDEEKLQRWLAGTTGVPFVDACMRRLSTTGFLNFRMRAMVVSFACHSLHLSWKEIIYPLAKRFLDYEPGIHISQLQMQAGVVGINTLRVYNPDKQMADHDSDLKFTKAWVPELRVASKSDVYSYSRVSLGSYPKPIVNFAVSSRIMKDAFYKLKKSKFGNEESARVLALHGSRKRSDRSRRVRLDSTRNDIDNPSAGKQMKLF